VDELQFMGYLVSAVITLGAFIAVVIKFTQPINDLRVVIQKLNDNIDALQNDNTRQSKKIEKHGEQIDELDHRVGKIETKIEFYHHKD
jgi:peptidoglycan hydrolase CwlO-like protein